MSGSLVTDPYGVRVDMMRDNLIALPNDVLQKIFAIMDLRGAPQRAAVVIQSIWRRIRAYFRTGELYRQDYVSKLGDPVRRHQQFALGSRGLSARLARYYRNKDRYVRD